jgi:hypothetical protein
LYNYTFVPDTPGRYIYIQFTVFTSTVTLSTAFGLTVIQNALKTVLEMIFFRFGIAFAANKLF